MDRLPVVVAFHPSVGGDCQPDLGVCQLRHQVLRLDRSHADLPDQLAPPQYPGRPALPQRAIILQLRNAEWDSCIDPDMLPWNLHPAREKQRKARRRPLGRAADRSRGGHRDGVGQQGAHDAVCPFK